MFNFQIDLTGDGYENVYPVENQEDPDVWIQSVRDEGIAFRAQVLFGGQIIAEMNDEDNPWSCANNDEQDRSQQEMQ